jgi:hypothetical protein
MRRSFERVSVLARLQLLEKVLPRRAPRQRLFEVGVDPPLAIEQVRPGESGPLAMPGIPAW